MAHIEIMTDKGGWQFEESQIIKIKEFDVTALTQFYNDNLKLLTLISYKYLSKRRWHGYNDIELDDLLNQVYVDLPYYDFSSRKYLYTSITNSFRLFTTGGIKSKNKRRIANKNIIHYEKTISTAKDEESTCNYLVDKYNPCPSPFDVLMKRKKDEAEAETSASILDYIEYKIKDETQLNTLYCQLFTDLKPKDIKGNEYSEYKQIIKTARSGLIKS